MTYSNDRLDRIEALLATIAESNAASTERLDRIEKGLSRTEKIVESNARAIEEYDARRKLRMQQRKKQLEAEEARWQKTRAAIADTKQMIATLSQQHQETGQRVEIWLRDSRADRTEMEQQRLERQKQFEQSMQARAEEHRVFLQNVEVLWAEISRLRGD